MSPVQISMIRYGSSSSAIVASARPTISSSRAGRLLGGGEREDLDLVELVGAQHATRVTPGRTGLAPVARAVRHEPHRELCFVEDLAGVDRRERHLGGGDAPQVVALDRVRVVGELGQLPGRGQRRGRHERRRADLLEGVGVAVERRTGTAPAPCVAPAPRCIVNIDPAILVARSLSRMPSAVAVSQCGTRWWSANESGRNGPLTTGLSASLAPSGASGCGQVGDRQQFLAELLADLVVLVGEQLLGVAERPALVLQGVGRGALAAAGGARRPPSTAR